MCHNRTPLSDTFQRRIAIKKRYKILLGILRCVLIFLAGGWAQEKFNLGADISTSHILKKDYNAMLRRL